VEDPSSPWTPTPLEAFALGISIHQECLLLRSRDACRKVDCGGGLAHPSLLIRNSDDLRHEYPCVREVCRGFCPRETS